MTLQYAESKDVDLFQLARLFSGAPSAEFGGDVSRLADLVRGSTRVAWATWNDHLVAFGSVLSDGAHFGLVTYLLVRSDFQGRGLEKELVDRLVAEPGVTFVMRASGDAVASCAAVGFRPTDAVCFTRRT